MPNRERSQPKIDPVIQGQENPKPLRKYLSQDDLASRTHRDYMKKLDEQRQLEKVEEESRSNPSGEPKL